jgi:tetratricopeptide (TPR) repeat protein
MSSGRVFGRTTRKETIVSRLRIATWVLAGSAVLALAACGGTTHNKMATPEGKIPITTASDEALESYLKGRWLLENLRATDARDYFLKAVAADPTFALAHLGVANTSPTAQDFFAAMRQAVDTAPGASEGEQLQIAAFEAGVNGEPETQETDLEALVAAYPEDERVQNMLGIFYFGQQSWEKAIAAYRAAIDINPDFAPPYNLLGYALRSVGDYQGAEEIFKRYTELIPDQPNPYDSYAELLMKMGRYEESIASYEKALEIDPNFVNSYVGIANNQMFMGATEEARETLTRLDAVVRNDGERRQALTWKAVSYLYDGDFDRALAEIQRRYDIADEIGDRTAMSGDLNLMGTIQMYAGRTDKATEAYEASVEMAATSDATDEVKDAVERNLGFDLARVALWNGDTASAAELAAEYRADVEVHQVLFEVQRSYELNGMIALAEGNPEEALNQLEQANQQNPQVWLLKARAFAAMGDRDSARLACEQVINFNQLNLNLGLIRNTATEMLDSM